METVGPSNSTPGGAATAGEETDDFLTASDGETVESAVRRLEAATLEGAAEAVAAGISGMAAPGARAAGGGGKGRMEA